MVKKLFIVILFASLLSGEASAQAYLGFANSVFAGVNSIDVNPALIVNSPRKWDVTVFGLNLDVANNYMGFQKRALEHTGSMFYGDYPAFNDPDNFLNDYISRRNKIKAISVHAGVNVTLPSFMFTRKKHNDAFAFTSKLRTYAQVDGIDPNLAEVILSGVQAGGLDSSFFNTDFSGTRVSVQTMIWNEYGLTYGKMIKQSGNERLSVGGRLKLLQGIYAMYAYLNDVQYKFYEKDSLLVLSSHVGYGHSPNLEFNQESLKFGFGGKPSFGLDLGATYEFHSLTDVRSRMSSQSRITPLQRDYKYKLGFSIQDLGWIKYLKPDHARDFTMEVDQTLDFGSLQGSGATPLADVDDTLNAKYPMDASDKKFRMNLPTLFSLQGDYYAGHNLYVNSTLNYAFQFKKNENKIHETTTMSITPRWDWKWLGFYMPISYNKYSHVRVGASARIGPLIVGMADILPIVSKRDVYGADVHVMLKVPHINFKKKNSNPRTKSKFDVKRDKPTKEAKKKKERNIKSKDRPQNSKKHIFPKVKIFKNKKKHKATPDKRDTIIYFQL